MSLRDPFDAALTPAARIAVRARKQVEAARVEGFGAALAALSRGYGKHSLARQVARDNGLTLKDFRAAGVEEFDMEQLRKVFR